jgi:hypothetical protein
LILKYISFRNKIVSVIFLEIGKGWQRLRFEENVYVDLTKKKVEEWS